MLELQVDGERRLGELEEETRGRAGVGSRAALHVEQSGLRGDEEEDHLAIQARAAGLPGVQSSSGRARLGPGTGSRTHGPIPISRYELDTISLFLSIKRTVDFLSPVISHIESILNTHKRS